MHFSWHSKLSNLLLLLSFSTRKHTSMASCAILTNFFEKLNSKSPTVPFRIVVCTFSDNLSWNSYNVQSYTCSSIIWVCGQNPTVWPFKYIPSGSNFTWCYLFFSILHVEIMLNNDFWPWVIIQAFTILWCTPRFSMRAGGQQNWLAFSRKPAYYFSLEISPV